MKLHKLKKSIFKSLIIRTLNTKEKEYCYKIDMILKGKINEAVISILPNFISKDNKTRPLILHKDIINKIEKDHGKIVFENFIINANNWDYIIKNVDGNIDKINLIKIIPNSHNFLTIGANRINGYFTVTHYESSPKNTNTLKNLLNNKGDSLNNIGETALSHLQLSQKENAS